MLWIGTAVILVAGIVALAVLLARRSIAVAELGSVSDQWIARHRANLS